MIGRTNSGSGGGGLSPNNAVIHVNAPVGSSISLSKGGVVVKVIDSSKSHINADNNEYADYYYAVSSNNYGTWTITATLDNESADETVTIDSNEQYDVALDYTFWLYKDGNEFVNRTGGWEIKHAGAQLTTKKADYFDIQSVTNNGQSISTVNKINLTGFSQLCMESKLAASGTNTFRIFGVWSSTAYPDNNHTFVTSIQVPNGSAGLVSKVNISNINGSYIIGYRNYNGNNHTVSKVWLE